MSKWTACLCVSAVIMLRVLAIIQQLLQEEKHASKRDIYYADPSIFDSKA